MEPLKLHESKNEILDHIHSHRSIRAYKNKGVSEEKLTRILSAASRASSSGNMQAYSIIVTTDENLKRELHKPHFEQSMVLEAPALMTFCADFHRMRRWIKMSDAPDNFDNFMSFMIATIDAVLASQNAALAAEAEGLGVCYLGTTLASCYEIAKILKCPEGVVPVVGFTLGYPDEAPEPRDRLPLSALVHRNYYEERSDAQIQSSYSAREQAGWNRYMNNSDLKKLTDEAGLKNLAQIYTRLKYTKESHEHYSEIVMKCLFEQGFLKTQSFIAAEGAGQ